MNNLNQGGRQTQNTDSIVQFRRYVDGLKPALKTQYQQLLAQDLSKQQWDGCFQRNVLAVLELAYGQALKHLQTLPFDSEELQVNQGLSELTKPALAAFDGFIDDFLMFAVDKHCTSCALSNFPNEHKPDRTYINGVKREIAGLWQNFAVNVNGYFLD
ncbi:amine oxidase [Candidatus Methylobacter oryzae]|uniref:Amine oxidase n=1 Tax=Candidatus Methylobacter oryzae TaxID=2497749 RepID=A0ABY3C6E8_9GAMM|nr:amine oxidase [Candidatus Methylobacter oryzae]TRW90800.1 amine oxidase [Candidatus Methylobacter oryzae]